MFLFLFYLLKHFGTSAIRIREAKSAGSTVVDVDGSYFSSMFQCDGAVSSTVSSKPLTGWVAVSESNHVDIGSKIPKVTHGKVLSLFSC